MSTSGALFVRPNNLKVFPQVNTLTLTCADVAPVAVGGISLDSDLRTLPLETANPDSPPWGVAIAIVAAACAVVAGGGAWYARHRWLS